MTLEEYYHRLPLLGQNVACSLYGWSERRVRLGRHFRTLYQWLLEAETCSRPEMEAYQDEQVALLIRHAYNSVPYYRRVMDERGLKPSDIVSRSDLAKLPALRKSDVLAHWEELLSTEYTRDKLRVVKTSGTTGTALKVLKTPEAVAFQWAVWWRHRARFGVRPLQWHLNFTGKPVVPSSQLVPPFWRWNLPMRQALISMSQLTRERAKPIADFINSHKFRFWTGYPSFVHSLAMFLAEQDIELAASPEYIFLGAENLLEFQRDLITEVFGARVSDQYGFAEGCGNASKCERDMYHEDWEFGILEIADGKECADGGRSGRILATGFANYAFPLIRYEVGDSATWARDSHVCQCGRASRVIQRIDGRNEDYVTTPEGAMIRRFDYLFKDTHSIFEAQVVQEELGAIVIRVVPRGALSESDLQHIRDMVKQWISPKLAVHFEVVKEIERSSNGKFRPVISKLSATRVRE